MISADFPLVTVLPFHAFLAALPALTVWFINHLDRSAQRALRYLDSGVPDLVWCELATSDRGPLEEWATRGQ